MSAPSLNKAVGRASGYSRCVLSYVAPDAFPMSVATEFTANSELKRIDLGPLSEIALPEDGQEVNLTFSHIHPVQGVGYDERRYLSFWGTAEVSGSNVSVEVRETSGWDESETPFFEYCERGLTRGHLYFEETGQRPRLGVWWLFFLATRLPFLTATVVPVLLGAAVAARHGGFRWSLLWPTLLGASFLHLGLNIANDVFDHLSGADPVNVTPTPFSGGSRVIQYGLLSLRAMAFMSVTFYTGGIAIGIYLAETRGRWLYAIGIFGIAISLFYTAPPLRLVNRGLGEGTVALGFGPITTVGAYYVFMQRFSTEALYLSLPVAILIALVLYVNEIPDRAGDMAAGKKTLVVRWRKERVVAVYAASVVVAYLLILLGPLLALTPAWTLLALSTIPMARKIWREIGANYDNPYSLMVAMQRNIGLHLFTGLFLFFGYVVDLLLS